MTLPDRVRRLFRIGGTSQIHRDLDDELRHHFEQAIAEGRARGLSPREARALAQARFGDERAYRRTLKGIDEIAVRRRERSRAVDTTIRTLTLSLRRLRRAPGFTSSVVLILALGIGANAVMFGVVDRLLLSPPQHVEAPEDVRLLHVSRSTAQGDVELSRWTTHPDYQDLEGVSAFTSVAGYTRPFPVTVGRGSDAERARVASASASLWGLLGVAPYRGRFFTAEEDATEAVPTAVLADEYWERRFGRDPDILGSSIEIGPGAFTVVGIAPRGFTGAELAPADIWVPLVVQGALTDGVGCVGSRGCYWMHAVARLAGTASAESATDEATAAHRGGRAPMVAEGRYDPDASIVLAPLISARGPNPTREAVIAASLAAVSALVLLIACLNAANLLLARALSSRRDVAVRLALGVSRRRLVGELLAESLLLAGLGTAVGLGLAYIASPLLHRVLLPNVSFLDAGLSTRVLLFALVAALSVGVVTSLVPIVQTVRGRLGDAMRQGTNHVTGGRRLRLGLLVGQAALSVVLLVGAGLFVRSLGEARRLDLGFDTNRIALVTLEWNGTLPASDREVIYRDVLEGVRRLPGVHAAALTYSIPFRSSFGIGKPRVTGRDSIPRHSSGGPYANKVSADYFRATGLTIQEGRPIEMADEAPNASPVAVVSRGMADGIWPEGGAVGSCMYFGPEEEAPPCTEVIGIVEDHRREALVEDDPHWLYYLNQYHHAFSGPPQAVMVGTSDEPGALLPTLRSEARSRSSQIRYVDAVALSEYVAPHVRPWRLGATMFSAFGVLALLVAAWGLYAVLAYDVTARGRELGIRAALGADSWRLVRMVFRQAVVLVGVAVGIGLLTARATVHLVEPLLFRVSGSDATTYLSVMAVLLGAGIVAGIVPAWRTTRLDPRETLQVE